MKRMQNRFVFCRKGMYSSNHLQWTMQHPQQMHDPTIALQMRIIKARQVNVMCKQTLIRKAAVLSDNNSTAGNKEDSPHQARTLKQFDYPSITNPTIADTSSASSALNEPTAVKDEVHKTIDARKSKYSNKDSDDKNFRPQQTATKLNMLAEDMSKAVTRFSEDLTREENQKLSDAKRKKKAAKDALSVDKKKIESLLKENDKVPVRMPLWRHRLYGRYNPDERTVLRGVRLFRVIARSLLYLILVPSLATFKRKQSRRESERKDLERMLKIVSGEFDDWFGKLIHLPVSSIVQVSYKTIIAIVCFKVFLNSIFIYFQDQSLNFESTESSYVGNTQPLRLRMMQLKVN